MEDDKINDNISRKMGILCLYFMMYAQNNEIKKEMLRLSIIDIMQCPFKT